MLQSQTVESNTLELLNSLMQKEYLDSIANTPVVNFGFTEFTYNEVKENEINLGLDLQGGMHVVLEVSPIEILKALTPLYFDENQKLSCITSAMHLIKLLTAEAQSNKEIFKLIDKFFEILNSENWIQKYIFWELELLKLLGYDLELKTMAEKEIVDSEVNYYVKSSTEKKSIPNFLIDENNMDVNLKNLLKGLKLVSDYLEKSILKPNNLNLPTSRTHFINLLK